MHVMSSEIALQRAEQGMQFLAVASDLRMMTAKAEEFLKTLKMDTKSSIAGY
jgi:2-keto-3-deoxy-L-rhamnonate aldolase RhmA